MEKCLSGLRKTSKFLREIGQPFNGIIFKAEGRPLKKMKSDEIALVRPFW